MHKYLSVERLSSLRDDPANFSFSDDLRLMHILQKYPLVIKRPLVPLLSALAAGIFAASFIHLPLTPLALLLAAAVFLSLSLATRPPGPGALLACMTALFLVGHISMQSVLHPPHDPDDISRFDGQGRLRVEGIVIESPHVAPDRTEIVLESKSVLVDHRVHTARGKVLLVMKEKVDSFKYGDFLRAETKLRTPTGYENPGAFDYARFLRLKGIRLQGFVEHPSTVVLIREKQGNPLRQWIESYRLRLRDTIRRASPAPESGILEALIVGERGAIPQEIREKFNRTGTAHILSISGLHIGIIAMVSLWLIRIVLRRSEYLLLRFSLIKVAAFLSLVPVFFYAFVAGMSIPTLRSVIMVVSFLIAVLLGRSRELLNALGLAAFLILLFSPASLFDISFQLSFASVFSIIYLTPKLAGRIPRRLSPQETAGPRWRLCCRKAFVGLGLFLAVSLTATLGTAPLVAHYFNRISLVSLPANLLVVPILGFIVLTLGLTAMVVSFFSTAAASLLFQGASVFVRLSLELLDRMDAIPGSSIIVTTPTTAEIAAFYLLLGVVAYGLSARRPVENAGSLLDCLRHHRGASFLSLALLLFFIVDMAFLFLKDRNPGRLRVTFLDVGHGNASLVEFPGGRRMLVDGGGSFDGRFDFGRHVVAPFLWKNRIGKIDIIVLTHPHPDHIGGLPYIVEHFAVEELWTNGERAEVPAFELLMTKADEKNVRKKVVSALTGTVEARGVSIRVLNPPKPVSPLGTRLSDRESNNGSLVLKLSYGATAILLGGDIAAEAETALARSGADLRSDVLLVPHHGARRSCTDVLLARVRPEYAVISARETSASRTPHPEVLERLERAGAGIYRTDRHGTVTVETDGGVIRIETYKPR